MFTDQVKKFIAFEWIMLLLLGLFWAGAMFLPLSLTGSFDDRQALLGNCLIMFGLYGIYFAGRSMVLIGKGLIWSYLTSNFFFKSQAERVFADEMFRFLVFGPVWILIMVVPMYFSGYFNGEASSLAVGVLFFGPYMGYLVLKLLRIFFGSIRWAVQVTIKK